MATRKTEPRHEVDRDAGQQAREARLEEVWENPNDPTGGAGDAGPGDDPWDQQMNDDDSIHPGGHPLGEQDSGEHDGASPVIEGDNPYEDPGVDLPGPDPMDLSLDDIRPEVETGSWLDDLSPGGGLPDPGSFAPPENNLDGANQAGKGTAMPGGKLFIREDGEVHFIKPGDQVTTHTTKGGIIQTPEGGADEVTNKATGEETVTVPDVETSGGGEEAIEGESGVRNVENDSWAESAFQASPQGEVERAAYKAARNAKIVADTKKEMEAKDKPADKPAKSEGQGSQPVEPEVDPELEAALRQYGEAKSHYMQIKLDAEVNDDVNPDPGGTETGTTLGYDPKDYLEGDEPHHGAGGQGVPTDGAIDYGPDDTDHDPDSGMDDPLPGQQGPLGPDTGWTPPEEDETSPEDEIDGMEFAAYDDGSDEADDVVDEGIEA